MTDLDVELRLAPREEFVSQLAQMSRGQITPDNVDDLLVKTLTAGFPSILREAAAIMIETDTKLNRVRRYLALEGKKLAEGSSSAEELAKTILGIINGN